MTKDKYIKQAVHTISSNILHSRLQMTAHAALSVVSLRKRFRDLVALLPEDEGSIRFALDEIKEALEEVEETLADERSVFSMSHTHAQYAVKTGLDELLAATVEAALAGKEEHALSDAEVRRQVLAMTDGRCTYCATIVSDTPVDGQSVKLFVEHVVPASKGGPNHLVNYVPSCGSCNSAKGDRHVLHFVRNVQPRRQEQSTVVSIVRAAE